MLVPTCPPARPAIRQVVTFRANSVERAQFDALADQLGLSFSATCRVALLALAASEAQTTGP